MSAEPLNCKQLNEAVFFGTILHLFIKSHKICDMLIFKEKRRIQNDCVRHREEIVCLRF